MTSFSNRLYVTLSECQQCWFGCSCRCHTATTVEVVFDVMERPNSAEQSVISEATPLQQPLPALEDFKDSRNHDDRVRVDSYRGNGHLHPLGAEASGDPGAVDGNPSVAQALKLNHPEGRNGFSSPRATVAPRSPSLSRGSTSGLHPRRGVRTEQRSLEIPSQAAPLVTTDRVGGGGICCAAACWFACACVCHTATDLLACAAEADGVFSRWSGLAPHAVKAVAIKGVARALGGGVNTPENLHDDDSGGGGGQRQPQLRQQEEGEEEEISCVSGTTSGSPVGGGSSGHSQESGTPGSAEEEAEEAPPPPPVVLAASEGAAAVEATDVGGEGSTRRRTAGLERRSRQDHEPSAAQARTADAHISGQHTPCEHAPGEHTQREHVPGEHTPDVQSAFLATSECGRRPRAIYFGTAARYRPVGPGGGTSAGTRNGETNEGKATAGYDRRWVAATQIS